MTTNSNRLVAVFRRELRTLLRSPGVVALSIAFAAVIVAIGMLSEASGFVPLALSLLTPLEFLVPLLAAGFAYRTILEDRRRGELAILRTYPISGLAYIGGVYAGQLLVFLFVVVVPLLSVALVIPLSGSETFLVTFSGLDSPLLYVRFAILTALYAAIVLSVMIAVSAVAASAKRAFALALALVVTLSIGLNLLVILGIRAGIATNGSLTWVLSLSPNSAYRGLVMALVVNPVCDSPTRTSSLLASLSGFCLWLSISFGTALFAVFD